MLHNWKLLQLIILLLGLTTLISQSLNFPMATTAARPLVTVQSLEGNIATDSTSTIALPDVMKSTIRPDIVSFVHANILKNKRQLYAISKRADHQTSVEAWGTVL